VIKSDSTGLYIMILSNWFQLSPEKSS